MLVVTGPCHSHLGSANEGFVPPSGSHRASASPGKPGGRVTGGLASQPHPGSIGDRAAAVDSVAGGQGPCQPCADAGRSWGAGPGEPRSAKGRRCGSPRPALPLGSTRVAGKPSSGFHRPQPTTVQAADPPDQLAGGQWPLTGCHSACVILLRHPVRVGLVVSRHLCCENSESAASLKLEAETAEVGGLGLAGAAGRAPRRDPAARTRPEPRQSRAERGPLVRQPQGAVLGVP